MMIVDAVADARQRLVDGVVDHLVDEVVQAVDIGAANVHARAFAHGIEAFENLDGTRVVVSPLPGVVGGRVVTMS